MDLHEYAVNEMNIAWPESDCMQELIKKDILDIVDMFSDQGHSDMSAMYVLSILERLLCFKPITPLTGEEDEWEEPYGLGMEIEGIRQQNKRCPSVFRKNFDNSTAYDIDGKVFSDDGGETFYSNVNSRVPVTFPYMPPIKPERIILNNDEN